MDGRELSSIRDIARQMLSNAAFSGLEDAERGRQLGFRGKLLIHPSQIEPVNNVFSPSEDEVEYARKVVEAFSQAEARRLGAISLDGKMIDVANFRQAQDLIALAEAIGQKEGE